MTWCEVTVRGPLARAVVETVTARFDSVSALQGTGASVLTVDCVDQAGLRALLTLLWDTGHEVVRLEPRSGQGLRATPAQP
jgi:hypothetical protein